VDSANQPVRRGAAALPQARALAPLVRRVTSLALALEAEDPALADLVEQLTAAEAALTKAVPADLRPRLADGGGDRVYLDHSHDIGAYNACFPEYGLTVEGDRAFGTVEFPLAFEGPPGSVHGGALSLFFDAVIQQHNCELGIAGKTVSLSVDYHRSVPLLRDLEFDIQRTAVGSAAAGGRSTSQARLYSAPQSADSSGGRRSYCTATVIALVGDVSRLPGIAPRRPDSRKTASRETASRETAP